MSVLLKTHILSRDSNPVYYGITFLFLTFSVFGSFAQETISIEGEVQTTNGVPIPYCSVIIKSKQKGTYSDLEGKFEIMTNREDSLFFSHLSFKNRSLAVKDLIGNLSINILLDSTTNTIPIVDIVPKAMKLIKYRNTKTSFLASEAGQGFTIAYHLTDHVGGILQEVTFYMIKPVAQATVLAGIRVFKKAKKMSSENNLYLKNDVRRVKKRKLKIDFSNFNIEIPPEGILIGLECISSTPEDFGYRTGRLMIEYTGGLISNKTYGSSWGNDWRLHREVHKGEFQNMKLSYKVLVEE